MRGNFRWVLFGDNSFLASIGDYLSFAAEELEEWICGIRWSIKGDISWVIYILLFVLISKV